MRIRYNLLFIPLLIIVAVLFWYVGFREEKELSARKLADRALVDIESMDIIEITRPDSIIRLEKSGGSTEGAGSPNDWMMVQPFTAGCDPVALANLIEGIFEAQSERDLEGTAEVQISEYGLDEPEVRLKLASSSGMVLMDLLIGGKNPSGSSRYATFAGNTSDIFLVPLYNVEPLEVTADSIRDARALGFNPDEIVSIQLSSSESEFDLIKHETSWQLSGEETFQASPARVDQLFHDLAELTAIEFLPSDGTAPELDTVSVRVVLSPESGESYNLMLHGEDFSRGIFASSSWQPTPFIVEAYIYDRLALDPDLFFHITLIEMSAAQMARVHVRQPGSENLEIERTGDGPEDWRILRPEGRAYTDPGDFENFITALLSLQPAESIPIPDRPEDYGLEPVYYLKIEIQNEGAARQEVIYLGSRDENGNYYATQDGYSYFTMTCELVDALEFAANKLKGVE